MEPFIQELMSKMSTKEKIGQLFQSNIPEFKVEGNVLVEQDIHKLIRNNEVGSLIAIKDPRIIKQLQEYNMEHSKHKIPLFVAEDIIHGCKTIFPINLGLACSFNESLIEKIAQTSAYEATSMGINLTFSPMADLVRDPRWGRVMESNGEDPYLNKVLTKAYVNGYQQDSLKNKHAIGACVKHFAAYGASESGREYNTVDISRQALWYNYLSGYQSAIDNNVASVMTAFNTFEGVAASVNSYLMNDVLREKFNFKGFVITDFTATYECIDHKVCKDNKDAALKTLNCQVDHEMVSQTYQENLATLLEEGRISEQQIDQACYRILKFKFDCGLFDDPFKNCYDDFEDRILQPEALQLSKEAAYQSCVLLKNTENALPLGDNEKVGIVGPHIDVLEHNGNWSVMADSKNNYKITDIFKNDNIIFSKGCHLTEDSSDKELINQAVIDCANVDKIVLFVGEPEIMSGEATSRAYLNLPGNQQRLFEALLELNKPIILVVLAGRPLEMKYYEDNATAILYAWFLGTMSSPALKDILFGKANPSGKLSMSFPYTVGQIPVYYNQLNTGRPSASGSYEQYRSSYIDIPNGPLYPFGYGLSYTSFKLEDITFSSLSLSNSNSIEIKLTVTNTGLYDGYEVVQLYVGALYDDISRPNKELKGFKKVFVKQNESIEVKFELTKEELSYYNSKGEIIYSEGNYNIFIGTDSDTSITNVINYTK